MDLKAADPALVEVVLSDHESLSDRRRALSPLGLAPDLPIRVAAIAVSNRCDAGAEALRLAACGSSGRSVRIAVIGKLAAMLYQQDEETSSPARDMCKVLSGPSWPVDRSVRVGVGASRRTAEAHESWEQARLALRFATPPTGGPPTYPVRAVVAYDALGVFAVLAKIPMEDLSNHRDMAALRALANTGDGVKYIEALQAFCSTGTLRSAAEELYLHHSTVADRLARAEAVLGWDVDDSAGRLRAQLALCARRLSESPPWS